LVEDLRTVSIRGFNLGAYAYGTIMAPYQVPELVEDLAFWDVPRRASLLEQHVATLGQEHRRLGRGRLVRQRDVEVDDAAARLGSAEAANARRLVLV
jgi:hypothetical protein